MSSSLCRLLLCLLSTAAMPSASRDVNGRKTLPISAEKTSVMRARLVGIQDPPKIVKSTPSLAADRREGKDQQRVADDEFTHRFQFGQHSDSPNEESSRSHVGLGEDAIGSPRPPSGVGKGGMPRRNVNQYRSRRDVISDVMLGDHSPVFERCSGRQLMARRSGAGESEAGSMLVGWNKRPRYHRENEGGTTRDWRTNMMRVWGKRSFGIRTNGIDGDIATGNYVGAH